MSSTRSSVDPATVEVIRNYLTSAATEMQRTLVRTAYNTIVYEILDFGISLYDAELRLVADSPGLAIFLGSNDEGIEAGVEHVGRENLEPGDVVLCNYPYWSQAHTLDVLVFSPIFVDDELVGFAACRAHWLDLGAKDEGYVLDSSDVYQEGIIFPGTKVYKKGEPDEEILDIIRFNSRIPDKVIGDLNAQIAALRTGATRVGELHERYGTDTVETAIERLFDHGARTAAEAVAALPDGSWTARGYADGIDAGETDVEIVATVTIDGESFAIDLTESADQLETPYNDTGGDALGKLCFKTVTTPEEDSNHGLYEPLSVETRPGSIFEPTEPAPTFVGWTGILAVDVVYEALAKGMPDLVPASSGGDLCSIMLYGNDPETGRAFVEANNEAVGWGATNARDGQNALMHVTETMVQNLPIEVIEQKAPVEIDRLSLRPDSGGPGTNRGGLGIRRDYLVTHPTGGLSIVQKTRTDGWGLDGGEPGAKNVVGLDLDDGWDDRVQILVDNDDLYDAVDDDLKYAGMFRGTFESGEIISNRSGGGGGYGDPFDRDPEAVREDVADGYVSREGAREDYGVAIDDGGEIDREATRSLRDR
ncbi:hydantoinase B/oxoprolinase family protein [Halovivax gelatinilyticus]|uniref:hydantoinase B/oxoprolinase family protein n=1 Tax=Halovivax gelatinilyticus TaxID=2961597 RepID=UPI0020CA8724|nr:hydantoinase B/oxoprolinase family protein [Halovivax gelatinilyticus]